MCLPPFSHLERSLVQPFYPLIIAMSSINILTLLLLLFHTLSGYSQQQSALQDTVQLEEVIVTSTKLPVSLKETIRPVTVITRRQIEQTPSANISHILQEHAGIRVNNSMGAPGESRSLDRKSTRLNSSHVAISYAVFCLNKKNT